MRRAMVAALAMAATLWGAGGATGGQLLTEAQALRRVDGAAVGTVGPNTWRSPVGGNAETGAEYLYYDLSAGGLNPAEGSIALTFRRGEASQFEAAFGVTGADGMPAWGITLEWGNPVLLETMAPSQVMFAYDRLPWTPAKGETVTLAFAWRRGIYGLWANGRPVGLHRDAAKDPEAFQRMLAEAKYLFVGGHPDPALPRGAWSQMHSEVTAFRVYDTFDGWKARSATEGVAAEKKTYGAGQEIVVTLRGTMDRAATFSIAGVASDVAMEEVDDGVYVGKATVPSGVNLEAAALTASLTDPASGDVVRVSGGTLALDGTAPQAPSRVIATVPWAGEVELGWTASPSADAAHYLVYRGEGKAPDLAGAALAEVKGLGLVDTAVTAGLTYQYAVVAVDQAGNKSTPSETVSATAVAGEGPAISAVTVEPYGKPVKPGQVVTLSVTGQSGGTVTADVGALATGLALAEAGRTGTYTAAYTVKDADVGATKTLHRVVAKLTDAYGASELAGPELAVVGLDVLNDRTAPVVSGASHDGFQVAGFSGALVAGDVVTVSVEGEPGGYAAFEVPGVLARTPMNETQAGTYTGTYTVGWSDEGTTLPVVAYLADEAGNETSLTVGRPLELDTRVRLLVTAKDTLLPADKKSTTRLVAKASDANGDDVSGHELALTLSTTEEYTGVVGGGRLEDREARMEDEDDLEIKWGGVTDSFGEVAATYTAGFAAKTALVVAKDLTTGDVGAGWLNTYVASTVVIELLPRAAARGMADKAILRLTADPAWLTADGRSTARLTATLTDLGGNPLSDQKVAFALGSDNGRIRVLRGTTDERGTAEAEYRAGTLAGFVSVTASAAEWGVTAMVQIELRADAPAKIDLVASAAKLPADGRSEATLSVLVTDIHDNPNIDVPVSFQVLEGSGDVGPAELRTDAVGAGSATFTAGTKAGLTTIEARHTSRAPTDEELRRIYGTVFVPRLVERQERDRIKVVEWLVESGDDVTKGTPLVTLEGGKATWTLAAPADGTFVREVKHRRDRVELGDTLGYVEIDPKVWGDSYLK